MKKIGEAIDGSLKRLKTDYIDLYNYTGQRSTNFFGRRDYSINESEGQWHSFEYFRSSKKIHQKW